jgi:gamma-glutamyltranspeptidase/glutathione hydrolase
MKQVAAILALVCVAPVASAQAPDRHTAEAKNGIVVAVCPIAADVGVGVLKKGGTAADAAVAVAFAEAVTWPEAGNIGGGGFMLVWPGGGREPTVFDYRETAPAAASRDLFADGKTDWTSHKAAGVPGTVRGLELAHKRFGKLPWKDVVMPALKLAKDGFAVDAPLARRLNGVLGEVRTRNEEFKRVYGKNGGREKWQAGDTLRLPDLGRTLRAIAENGADEFYTGENAARLEAEMKAGGGLMTAADLAAYRAKERKPVRGSYRGFDVYAPPPPSSGGVAVVEALNILDCFDLKKHPRQSPETIHLMAEAMRRAFCDRARHIGDPDFVTIPDHLITQDYAKKLAAGIDPVKATRSETLAPELTVRETADSTTHFSVIDKDGMAVANTYTLENSFGNRVVVRGGGYLLNNEMTDFNPRPGVTTRSGLIGTEPNQIAPGKRMVSSMTPTIVVKDGKPYLVTGSPGGRTIINTVLCVVVNVIDYDMGARAAVDEPRLHHQWFPDRVMVEKWKDKDDLWQKLAAMGHAVGGHRQGDAHTIRIDPKTGRYQGAADRRLNGKAAGY